MAHLTEELVVACRALEEGRRDWLPARRAMHQQRTPQSTSKLPDRWKVQTPALGELAMPFEPRNVAGTDQIQVGSAARKKSRHFNVNRARRWNSILP